jgi:hypothetical protein
MWFNWSSKGGVSFGDLPAKDCTKIIDDEVVFVVIFHHGNVHNKRVDVGVFAHGECSFSWLWII